LPLDDTDGTIQRQRHGEPLRRAGLFEHLAVDDAGWCGSGVETWQEENYDFQ
jgi:hypothetical protein